MLAYTVVFPSENPVTLPPTPDVPTTVAIDGTVVLHPLAVSPEPLRGNPY